MRQCEENNYNCGVIMPKHKSNRDIDRCEKDYRDRAKAPISTTETLMVLHAILGGVALKS